MRLNNLLPLLKLALAAKLTKLTAWCRLMITGHSWQRWYLFCY
jgi:hypothetical protein